ncbi:MAG TPA: NAD(P)/FAD-dependent oxidoreductase [Flavisolibacter sp.]|jgi:thioredoxin reductase|nr:NAD(P)/FAD-dependent oxidoreductase [Flavisolibacter sp.]
MTDTNHFDVIVVGGSYSGLAAGMSLGRALKKTLLIDSGKPCNRQTPRSHNFLTRDGSTPKVIADVAREQLQQYDSVHFFQGTAIRAGKTEKGFEVQTDSGALFTAQKLIFATGIKDLFPPLEGFAECWGISVIHCPYCHGYEVRGQATGILSGSELAYDIVRLIHNWTKDLTLFTNGPSPLTEEQMQKLKAKGIPVIEKEIERLEHRQGQLNAIVFKDGTRHAIPALYAPVPFEQHSILPAALGCEMTEEGFIRVDGFQETTIKNIYACGDATTRLRTVANAVSMGTTAGMMASRSTILEEF